MKRQHDEIGPDRLMEAVDAVFVAWEDHASEGIDLRHPLDILGAADMPACLADFTRAEIAEASRFLERIGVIVRVDKS